MSALRAAKRMRTIEDSPSSVIQSQAGNSSSSSRSSNSDASLRCLLQERKWNEATALIAAKPSEAATEQNPSPLALACRLGAPFECVRAILEACPAKLRHVIDARGTPIHEAIVCENVGASVIEVLLRMDETIDTTATTTPGTNKSNNRNEGGAINYNANRATLSQDVDGFTPLHLLIRRRFQAHILNDESANLMQILEMLVQSCPEAVLIPDRGEYEEPPIVYALKANIYAPALVSDDDTIARVERQIYEMAACMLKYCPEAASQTFTGYRGQYTALHSAVFHGRNTGTIELLLQTEASVRRDGGTNCVLANTQGELPLHFCAMRGERPRSVALIANAAPNAVIQRDASGLTPLHWLWARFVSSLLALDRLGAGDDATQEPLQIIRDPNNRYSGFASLEQGNFELDLQLIKRMDPPVDFLRMRHIPIDVLGPQDSIQWADSAVALLQHLRTRYEQSHEGDGNTWTRRECVIALFWTKVVSFIEAATRAMQDAPRGNSILVHSAFGCCLPALAHIAASLFPEELSKPDDRGRVPLHYAVSRPFHEWDWPLPRPGGSRSTNEGEFGLSASAQLLQQETLHVIRTALNLSPPDAMFVRDNEGRLPLHDLIDNLCRSDAPSSRFSKSKDNVLDVLKLLDCLIERHPASLQCRDGRTKLFPFLQAAAVAHQTGSTLSATERSSSYDMGLSISYHLLRENPTIAISQPGTHMNNPSFATTT